MNFSELCSLVKCVTSADFFTASKKLEDVIFSLSYSDFLSLLTEIGTIPEDIPHDSSEEKLYAKAADVFLARCFQELGLKASVNRERSNCADVIAKSYFHNYSLVGDAKTFRLSRTAKNQKDFKVKSMMDWRGDSEYSVLVCPFFQYPKVNSQIYGQSLDGNVSLFSWEHLSFLLRNSIKESFSTNLGAIWNISSMIAIETPVANKNNSFLSRQNQILCNILNIDIEKLNHSFDQFKKIIIKRGNSEIAFWRKRIEETKKMSRKEAIQNLLNALKLDEKIVSIQKFIDFLDVR